MTRIYDSRELSKMAPTHVLLDFPKETPGSQMLQRKLAAAPIKLEIDPQKSKDQFNHFLNFVEKVTKDKDARNLSQEAIQELKNWFPFIKNDMTVFLNIDLYLEDQQQTEPDVPTKLPNIQKVLFPTPLPRKVSEPTQQAVDMTESSVEEQLKSDTTPEKLFIPGVKKYSELELSKPFEVNLNKRNISNKLDVEVDNMFLSNLLKKRNGDDHNVVRTYITKSFKPDDLNVKLMANHVAKVRSFWDGSNTNYPHSFKKKILVTLQKNRESYIIETQDHSKKTIPTSPSEQHSDVWE